MKKYLMVLLLLCLALTLPVAAADAEAEYYYEIGPVVDALRDPPVYYSSYAIPKAWPKEADCYGDILSGTTKDIYLELERKFAAYVEGTEEIPLQRVNFPSGARDAWTISDVISGTFSSATARDIWVEEQKEAAEYALLAFLFDHPEYFWIRQHYGFGRSWGSIGNRYTGAITIYFITQEGFDDLEEQQADLRAQAARLLDAVKGLTDAQKVAWWDNWLAVNNRYNGDAADIDDYIDNDATPWCAWSALTENTRYQPVCEGYAKALQLLCREAGIPCVQLSGSAGGAHMWAAVKLDGTWYFCDPTWNDPGRDEESAFCSTREYLLTYLPYSHSMTYYEAFGLPVLSEVSYGAPMKNDFGWSAATDHTPLGYEVGSGTMIIALYDQEGRFLTMGACSSIRWDWYENIYLAPAFSDDVLAKTGSIVRFCLTDAVNWKPAAAQAPIR